MIDQAAKLYVFADGEALELHHAPKGEGVREVGRTEFKRAQKAHALAKLRTMIKPKDTIYCVLKHRASSGMSRTIDFFILHTFTGGSVGGKSAKQLRRGDHVYFWQGEGSEARTVDCQIVKAPRGMPVVSVRRPTDPKGHSFDMPRAQLTFRDTSKHTVPVSISALMAQANGYTRDDDRGGLKVHGCGMDMGFSIVYGLGCALWPNGTDKPHGTRNGEPDSAGGYAIGHRWL